MDILRVNILFGFCLLVAFVEGSHFRGGTISWTPTGNGNEVEFKFRLAWTHGNGPGCTTAVIGQLVTRMSSSYWMCNICTPSNIENVNYICTGASITENWEQGERTFRHTFSGVGPYTISFTGGDWMSLNYGSPGNWIVQTTVDLRNRSDTRRPNISPITASKPIYKLQSACTHALKIPMIDPDGDNIRCRWSTPTEAASISRLLPNATIDEQTCTIHFTASASQNYVPGGWYAVAITIEDYPKRDIIIDGIRYTPHSKLSTVPLQFLINTPALNGSCSEQPVFVSNTPAEGTVIRIRANQTLRIRFYASSRYSISNIMMTSPAGLTSSSLKTDDMGRARVRYTNITWTPSQSQKGSHILCGLADDSQGKTSDPRCITLLAWDRDPCESTVCEHNGTCSRVGFTDNFLCACVPGFTGLICETVIVNGSRKRSTTLKIDECASTPCQNAGSCLDLINMYQCVCAAGYSGVNCEIEIDECASTPCQNAGSCLDLINMYQCVCAAGYSGVNCEIEIDECASTPCQNAGSCLDLINMYQCVCAAGYSGVNCEIEIDECASTPCQNAGSCLDLINMYQCVCVAGYSGVNCEIEIDECASTPCQNTGSCLDLINMYQCVCVAGYSGVNCEIEIDECASTPCQNAGSCLDLINMYQCVCVAGYSGVNCEIDIDECLSKPCQHSSTCNDHVNHFTCTCTPGYSDVLCQTDINECLSRPCQNGGSCLDLINSYHCACRDGFTGINCETDINECASSPCLQNATCIDQINSFKCVCPQGWSGVHCQTGLDHCVSFPCLHNGTCHNIWGGFRCDCPAPWRGNICEYRYFDSSQECEALEYTECDCVINTKKKRITPKHNIRSASYGMAIGIVCSLGAYVIWVFSQPGTSFKWSDLRRIFPMTGHKQPSSNENETVNLEHSLTNQGFSKYALGPSKTKFSGVF